MNNENLTSIVVALLTCVLGSLLCFLAWNGWAWEFNLPQFSYWHWLATYTAIRGIIGRVKTGG